jgi:23S rRNA (guanine2445-N2)-methyltransferase / 23S rRNA (guanine2069-N7)-methyltransferase
MKYSGFGVCTSGVEPLLKRELEQIGIAEVSEGRGGVRFSTDLKGLYEAVLWSRTASRILRTLIEFPCASADDLYSAALEQPWETLFAGDRSFRVDVSGQQPGIEHTGFAGLKLKDAIVDRFRARTGGRPDVERDSPDVVVHLHLSPKTASLSLDLCGRPLHERGWRQQQSAAPMKETLAAALLIRAGWPAIAAAGGALVDPLCGGGTLLIEGLLMAADVAPGLLREDFTLRGLSDFDAELWSQLQTQAQQRATAGIKASGCRGYGFDHDPRVIVAARLNARSAGLAGLLSFEGRGAAELAASAAPAPSGLLICNPPYGERLGDARELQPLYRALGAGMRAQYGAWTCAVYSSDDELLEAVNLPVRKRYMLMNGPLRCTLALVDANRPVSTGPKLSAGAVMLRNRIDKNRARLKSYLASQQIQCYRAYDADLPEYACAIDVYTEPTGMLSLHVQEYLAPRIIPEADQERHLRELLQVASQAFDCPKERIFLKQRQRQRGTSQYRRFDQSQSFFKVNEGGLKFEVNLADFLDTGLFLDSRTLRHRIRQRADDARFLNLFCYTGSATVYAAAGAAHSSVSVDLSPTYTRWAGRNFALNQLDPQRHRIVQADSLTWMADCRQRFDLIYLDPPTFSNSKRTTTVLDTRRDHCELIDAAMALLDPAGSLIFCSNAQGLSLDPELEQRYQIEEWTKQTIPPDFDRPKRIHRSFVFRQRT